MKTTVGKDGTALKDLSACDAPPQNILSTLSVEQIDACDNPQIIQRVKGARYILHIETNGPLDEEAARRIKENFSEWWMAAGAAPPFLTRFPVRVECIILPEVPE